MSKYSDIKKRVVGQMGSTDNKSGSGYSASGAYYDIKKKIKTQGTKYDIDDEYLDSFYSDAKSFFDDADSDYNNNSYSTAKANNENYKSRWSDLNSRAEYIRSYINSRKNSLDDETYSGMMSYLDQFNNASRQYLSAFRNASNYYSQWKTEDEYNDAVEAQKIREKMLSDDLDAAKKDIDALKAVRDTAEEASNNRRNVTYNDLVSAYTRAGYGINAKAKAKADYEAIQANNSKIDSEIASILEGTGYSNIDELNDAITKKSAYYNQSKRLQDSAALYDKAKSASDFSHYASVGDALSNEKRDGLFVSEYDKKNKIGYLRNNPEAMDAFDKGATRAGNDPLNYPVYKAAKYMTNDEYKVYSSYLGRGDTETAEKYLSFLDDELNQRAANAAYKIREGNTLSELIFGVEAGLDQFKSGVKNLFNTNDEYIAPSYIQYASGMVREDLSDAGFNIFGSSLGQIGYDLITTTSNMMPSILASSLVGMANPVAGTVVGAGLMGASAAGNAYQEMLNLGYDKGQARTYSTLTGLSEAGLQYVLGGIGKLGGAISGKSIESIAKGINNAAARFAIQFGGEMASEGLEEFLQDIIDPFFKSFATKEFLEIPEGYLEQAVYSGMLGALSAGVLNSFDRATNRVMEYGAAKQIKDEGKVNELVKVGKLFSADTVAYKLADKVTDNTGAWKLSKLLHEVNANLSEQNQADIKYNLVRSGMREADADTVTEWLAKAVDGAKFTTLQQKALDENPIISRVFKKVIIDKNSTVNQRIQGMMNINGVEGKAGIDYAAIAKSQSKENLNKSANYYMAVKQAIAEINKRDLGIGRTTAFDAEMDRKASEFVTEYAKSNNSLSDISAVKAVKQDVSEKVSDSNKTTIVSTGEEVTIKKIKSISNGNMELKLTNGNTVNSKDIKYKSQDEALVYESVLSMGYSADTANAIVNGYNALTGVSASNYLLGVNEAYNYGRIGYPQESIKSEGFYADLTDAQKRFAYNLGREAADAETKAAKKSIKKGSNNKTGKVHMTSSLSSMTNRQKVSVSAIGRIVADVTHNDVYLYESVVKDGKRVFSKDIAGHKAGEKAPNGFYDPNTGAIFIDINAGNGGEGVMLWTAAHELTHFVRQWSPEKFKILADFLMEEYGKHGVDIKTLIRDQINKAKRRGRKLSFDGAYEEVVADAMQTMFTDTNLSEKIAKLKAKDETLWQKIKSFFADLYKRITEAYKGLDPQTDEAKFVRSMKDSIEKLSDMFAEAIVDAGEAFSTADVETINNAGFQYDEETGIVYSDRFSTGTENEAGVDRDELINSIVNVTGRSKSDVERFLVAEEVAAMNIKGTFLDFEGNEKEVAIKTNSDYPQGTIDLTNICTKRVPVTNLTNRLQEALPEDLFTADDYADIRLILMNDGRIVACGLCFVEDRRQYLGEIAQEFIKEWNSALQSGGNLKRVNSAGKIKDVSIGADLAKRYGVTSGLITPTKIKLRQDMFSSSKQWFKLQKNHPEVAVAFEAFNNARGQSAGRLLLDRAEYKREILKWSDEQVKFVNSVGGLRIFSFSDFETVHLLDLLQIIEDCAARGVMIQGYTKQPKFAKLVSKTGIKLNRSFIPYGATGLKTVNGKKVLAIDTVEGINNEDVNFLDEVDNPNVGNNITGISDEQIHVAMKDNFFHYIIPFHTNKKASANKKLGVANWRNYKFYQTDKTASSSADIKKVFKLVYKYKQNGMSDTDAFDKAMRDAGVKFYALKEDKMVNIYTDVLGDPSVVDEKSFLMKYLEVCNERDIVPRYAQFLDVDEDGNFLYTEGYTKFLVDFKLFDYATGEILYQGPVTPEFDSEFIQSIINDEFKKTERERSGADYPEELYNDILNYIRAKHGYGDADMSSYKKYKKIVNEMVEKSNRDENGTRGASLSPSVKSQSEKLSDRDSEYLELAKNPKKNEKRLRELVDDAAIEAGALIGIGKKPILLRHGTNADFYTFDGNKTYPGTFGYGHYFATDKSTAESYGRREIKSYLITNKIVSRYTHNITPENIERFLEEYGINSSELYGYYTDSLDEWVDKHNDLEIIKEAQKLAMRYETGKSTSDLLYDTTNILGVDASEVHLGSHSYYVVYNNSVIKSADLVTYDDNGNIIPLSERFNSKNDDIRYSGRDDVREIQGAEYQKMVDHFGTTRNFDVAGYMLGNGLMLDFSGKHWGDKYSKSRQVDHRDIQEVLESKNNGIDAMVNMLANGNIRLSPEVGGINLAVMPNNTQLNKLRDYVRHFNGEVIVDIDEVGGDTIHTFTYNKGTNPAAVIRDIKAYFEDGTIPQAQPEYRQFLYSGREEFVDSSTGEDVKFSVRDEDPPKNTIKGYKVFVVKDGKLYPPMVANPNGADTPVGVWLNADIGARAPDSKTGRKQVKAGGKGTQGGSGSLAFRPGWHLGEIPLATQFDRINPKTGVKELFPENFVWAECDIAADVDYQEKAMSYGYNKNGKFQHSLAGLPELPVNGYYRYRTNPNPDTVPWLITGAMKVNKLLSDAEVNEILAQNGIAPKQRQGGNKTLADLGLAQYEGVKYSDRDPDATDNRTLLSNALESAAQNEIEKKYIEQYKSKIDTINDEQKKLTELRAKIKELSFAKGHRDAEQISKLQSEATKTANLISKFDKQLLKLEATKPLKDVIDRERTLAKKKAEKAGKEALSAYREKAVQTQRELMDRYQERIKIGVENRRKHEFVNKIEKIAYDIQYRLEHPSAKTVIPEVFGKSVANFLKALDFTTFDNEGNVREGKANKTRAELRLSISNLADNLAKVSIEADYGQLDISADMLEWLKKMSTMLEEKYKADETFYVRKMNSEELGDLYKLIKSLQTSINQASKFYTNMSSDVGSIAYNTIIHLEPLYGKTHNTMLDSVDKLLRWDYAQPITVFDRFGDSGRTLMRMLMQGQKTMADNAEAIENFVQTAYTAEEVNKWREELHKITIQGKTYEVSTAFLMEFHNLLRDPDAKRHILEGGGIRFDDLVIGKKKTRFGDTYVTFEEAVAIDNVLTERQKQVAESLEKFLSEKGADWGNKISMRRFGYHAFGNIENYYPIKTIKAGSEYEARQKRANIYALLNKSFTKERNIHADNAIIVGDIFKTFNDHMSEMALYNAWALPVIDLIKWFNYRETQDVENKKSEVSVKEALRQAYGKNADEYIRRLLESINSQNSGGLSESIAFKNLRIVNRVAVSANLRVAIQQPFSITRAMELISPKYVKPLVGDAKNNAYNEMVANSSFGKWKSMGYYDVDVSRPLEVKVLKNASFADKITEKTMFLAEAGDNFAWAVLWNACKAEVSEKNKGITNDELIAKTGERFDDIIIRTQVVDSVLTKSQWMRSDSFFHRMTSSFMSESMTSYNTLLRQYDRYSADAARTGKKSALKMNGKPIATTVTVFVLTQLINALVTAPLDAARDDDDYKTFLEKMIEKFKRSALQNLLPTSMMPYIADIVEYAMYGNTDRPDLQLYTKAIDLGKQLKRTIDNYDYFKLHKLINSALSMASSISGIPMSNIARDAIAVWNTVVGNIGNGELKFQTSPDSSSVAYEKMYEAIVNGKTDKATKLYAQMQSNSVSADSINSALTSRVKQDYIDGKIDSDEASKLLKTIAEYTGKELTDDEIYWKIDKWNYEDENGTSDGYAKYDDFLSAVETGKDLRAVIQEYTENGVDKKTLASQITSHFKPIYVGMTRSERASIKGYLLNAYALLGYNRTEKSKDIDNWVK